MKRLLDSIAAVILLLLCSPALLVLCLLVGLRLGRPVFFRQQRPGLHGCPFLLVKFRTMTDARDRQGRLLPDAERMTGLGRFLRATSLDELPTLWNVIKGEMSLVGPRPLLMQYLDRYTPEQARRHEVRPGITGWAQVNGRNALTWEEKFRLDVWYVDHRSLLLDLRIVFLTLWKVIRREGISQEGEATAREFMGTEGGDSPDRFGRPGGRGVGEAAANGPTAADRPAAADQPTDSERTAGDGKPGEAGPAAGHASKTGEG